MLRIVAVALALGLAWGGPALARTFTQCDRSQQKAVGAAIDGALDLSLHAAAAVGDTGDYARWFGAWSAPNAEEVRSALKAVHAALVIDDIETVCLRVSEIDCKEGTYAYVLFDRPRVVHLCPIFFAMPTMADALASRGDMENGTREGTIIHEMSHFPAIAATEDHCYSRGLCEEMATNDPRRAIDNADSYQYFAEDAMVAYLVKSD